jgi:type IV pilus assembly protein PilE
MKKTNENMTGQVIVAEEKELGHARQRGFTLIELMVTVVIIAILARLAIPQIRNQIREARRTDAKTALLDIASREERFYATNNTYTSNMANLFASGASWPLQIPDSTSPNYSISAPTVTSTSFAVAAVPVSSADQNNDSCATYTLNYLGVQGNMNNTITTGCW